MRTRTLLTLAFLGGIAPAQTPAPGQPRLVQMPPVGFTQNMGQFGSGILFALGDRLLYRERVRLAKDVWMEFAGPSPFMTVAGQEPLPAALNLYLERNPERWAVNVPHFRTVRYAQVYPGVDIDFVSTAPFYSSAPSGPGMRITVAPGADPGQIGLSLATVGPLVMTVAPEAVMVQLTQYARYSISNLSAYQPKGESRVPIAVKFARIDSYSFRPEAGAYDPALPLVFEFERVTFVWIGYYGGLPGPEDAVLLNGSAYQPYAGYGTCSALSRLRADGSLAYLTLVGGVTATWFAADPQGGVHFASGIVPARPEAPELLQEPPITPGAPQPNAAKDDAWLGRFDRDGRLVASTYAGSAATVFASDSTANVYFSTGAAVTKWTPGESRFGFSAPVARVKALATNAAGELAFVTTGSAGLPTTAGAARLIFEGPWTQYAGKLDPVTGALRVATYYSVSGSLPPYTGIESRLALAPDGNLWIATRLRLTGASPGTAHTLVVLQADGTRVLNSESQPFWPLITFDPAGNGVLAGATNWPNLPTTEEARQRVPCVQLNNDYSLYVAKRAPAGGLLEATYVPASFPFLYARILGIEGLEEGFTVQGRELGWWNSNSVVQLSAGRPASPSIACLVSPATRQSLRTISPGELVTISGALLGPREAAVGAVDAEGNLPLQLGGVEVLIGGRAMPLAAVQQGSVTFYAPPDMTAQNAALEVRSGGEKLGEIPISIAPTARFAVFTADGSGRGVAAAINQDGSLNATKGAPTGSVVAVYGIGTTPPTAAAIGYENATVEYAGPAPGLVPGVKQINLRIPQQRYPQPGDRLEILSISPGAGVSVPIQIRCLR